MISTNDFRKGMRLEVEGELYLIVDFQNARTAQRRAKVTTKLKNIKTGAVIERVFASGETFEKPDFEERTMQFMYNDNDGFHFMDNSSYEQVALSREQIAEYVDFMMANSEYRVLFYQGQPLSMELPPAVVLAVTDAEPGVKGDTVSNLTKAATLETGLVVKVPLFIKVGDKIKVDTRSKEYLERSN